MESELLRARVEDLISGCTNSSSPRFIGFLSQEETSFVKTLKRFDTRFVFFGGEEMSERLFLCVAPENFDITESAFPITALTFTFRTADTLSHRDVLGSLMALGIKRETVGDILIEQGRAVVFVAREIAKYVAEQISRIGRVGVTVSYGFEYPLPQRYERVRETSTVASLRLDCVVATLIKGSRNKAAELIVGKYVTVNSALCEKTTKAVASGDKISVRGYGKFSISSIDGTTRKGRIVLTTETYK